MKHNITALFIALAMSASLSGCNTGNESTDNSAMSGRYVEKEIILPAYVSGSSMGELTFSNGGPAFIDYANTYVYRMNEKKNSFTASSYTTCDEGVISYSFVLSGDGVVWDVYTPADSYLTDQKKEMLIRHSGKTPESFHLGKEYDFSDSYLELSENGRIFTTASPLGNDKVSGIYEILPEQGCMSPVREFGTEHISSLDIAGDYLVSVCGDEAFIYNYVTGRPAEPSEALNEFIKNEKLGEYYYGVHRSFDICGGEDGTLYIACAGGLYRYVIGGNQIEQLIDGAACHLGNPSWEIRSVLRENDVSFLVSYTNGRIMRYFYDKTAENSFSSRLYVFSLEKNETAMYTMDEYRSLYPEVEVIYQTAKSDDHEDAIKELYTLLEGQTPPDVIITDGIDIEDLKKDNVLLQLSGYETEIFADGEFIRNIAQPDKNNWYTMPCRFMLPCVAGEKNDLSEDYSGILAAAEQKTDSAVSTGYSADDIISTVLTIAWDDMFKDKVLTEEELSRFYESCCLIWQDNKVKGFAGIMDVSSLISNYMWDEDHIPFICTINNITDLMNLYAFPKADENAGYQLEQGYIPSCSLAINANSANRGNAIEFLKTAVSENVQSIESEDGLPVSKTVLRNCSKRPYAPVNEYRDDDYIYIFPGMRKLSECEILTMKR